MPLPLGLARFNRVVTNRVAMRFAGTRPGFAVIEHKGRVSGRGYETPVNCWADEESVVIALTYGEEVDWLKNLKSAGGGVLRMEGARIEVGPPRVVGEVGLARLPAGVRRMLRLIGVDRCAELPILSPGRPI